MEFDFFRPLRPALGALVRGQSLDQFLGVADRLSTGITAEPVRVQGVG
jgi:hypothetical protein